MLASLQQRGHTHAQVGFFSYIYEWWSQRRLFCNSSFIPDNWPGTKGFTTYCRARLAKEMLKIKTLLAGLLPASSVCEYNFCKPIVSFRKLIVFPLARSWTIEYSLFIYLNDFRKQSSNVHLTWLRLCTKLTSYQCNPFSRWKPRRVVNRLVYFIGGGPGGAAGRLARPAELLRYCLDAMILCEKYPPPDRSLLVNFAISSRNSKTFNFYI